MFPSMQPSRPRIQPSRPLQRPLNQQPTRTVSSFPLNTSTPAAQPRAISALTYELPRPRNQREAMPSSPPPPQTLSQVPAPTVFDASRRHPVFFTDRLKRAPNGVRTGGGGAEGGGWMSPVSEGYVFEDGVKKRVEGVVKL